MKPGQRIHASVAFCPTTYSPKSILSPNNNVKEWTDLVGVGDLQWGGWTDRFKDILELDIFDDTTAKEVIRRLKSGPDTEQRIWLHRLLVMTWSCEFFGIEHDTS
jgi:hypothetical protein